MLHYVDDVFSYDMDPNLVYYAPYNTSYPSKQVQLLRLFDEIGLPHEQDKQVFGQTLTIIGLNVDPVDMTLTPNHSKSDLVSAIRCFIDSRDQRRCPLLHWQCMLGWINWALNAFPLLKPGLQSSYAKIHGKALPHASIYLNRAVIQDLAWVADVIEASDGICMLSASQWHSDNADTIIYCDASAIGMGFFIPHFNQGYFAPIPDTTAVRDIFFFEALCIICAVTWATEQTPQLTRPR
jgi:hypothetical protein